MSAGLLNSGRYKSLRTDGNNVAGFDDGPEHRKYRVVIALLVIVLLLCIASIAAMAYFIARDLGTAQFVSPPNITYCPSNLTRSSSLKGPTKVPVWWIEPSVANPSGENIAYYATHQPGDMFEIGNTTVMYNFTADGGLLSVCKFVVSVILIDSSPPNISNCPRNVDANVPDNDNKVAVTWKEPTATSSNHPVTIIKPDQLPGSYFSIGTTTMNYMFIDSLGFRSSCSFLISVFDITPPSIKNCPKDITHNVTTETGAKVSWPQPEATDNSGKVSLVSQSHKPGDMFPVGGTSVEYVYSDPSGNIKLCSFVVRVIELDGTPPAVTDCPNDISNRTPADDDKVKVSWTEPTAKSSRPVSTIKPDPSQSPGSYFSIGSTTINYVFIDSIGLRSTCSFFISVLDTTPPSIKSCPKDITHNVSTETGAKVTWVEPEATDNSGKVSFVSQNHKPGDVFPLGGTSVEYVYSDPSGNIKLCSFVVRVIVIDGTPPLVTNCPTDISHKTPSDDNKVKVTWAEPTAESSRPVSTIKPDPTHSSGSYFSIGTTAINYVFIDSIGLRSTCAFFISVVDDVPPVVHQCPVDLTFYVAAENEHKAVDWTEPIATDNSGQESLVSQTHRPGDFFPVGRTAVQYMFKDPTGNINMCSFFVEGKVSSNPNASDTTQPSNYGVLLFSILFTIFITIMQWTKFL